MSELIPIVAIVMGCAVPLGVFIWLYFEQKDKNKTVLEIAKHMDDPSRAEEFLHMLDERKKEPIDYRRGGVITIFVGIGIYLLGFTVMGALFEGIGLLVGAIGVGTMVAGHLYPNTSEELTNAVENFEEN
tara:strand:- start:3153 stop:3542 length:390 start_codon:yes stop_codon:yes gene_type:complete